MHRCTVISSVIILCALVFLLSSLYSLIFEVEYNKCEMTYMMQFPEYIPVNLPRSVQRKFPNYNLFVYTEGHSEPVRRGIYEGIPVLFIPGNDGSHKQVRSLASVAIQMRRSLRTEARFDYFAVDLNSEFSALHGPFLYRQSEFVQHVIDHIESLYPTRARLSIILIGHSMGGLVARHVMTLDGFDKGRVPLIVTLATPHLHPVLNTDSHMSRFYAELNSYWRSHKATSLGHVAVVSIGGGDRDIEVALGLTRLDGLAMPRNSVWASAAQAQDVWASTDHRCIAWCKQLVIALSRALFTVAVNRRFSGGPAATADEFRRRLLPSPPAAAPEPAPVPLSPSQAEPSRWFHRDLADPRHRAFRFERDRLGSPIYVKIVAHGGLLAPGESAVFLLDGSDKVGASNSGWLFACTDPIVEEDVGAPCKSLIRLDSVYGRDLPPGGLRRRLARVDAHGGYGDDFWRRATAFVAVLGPSSEQTELHFDLRSAGSRNLQLNAPWPWPAVALPSELHLPAGSLYFAARVAPPAALFSGRGLELSLESHHCGALVGSPGALVQDTTAVGGGYSHAVQYFNQNASLPLADCGGDRPQAAVCRVHVIVNPLCEHSLLARVRPQQFGAALLREAGHSLPTWTALHILSALLSSLVQRGPKAPPPSLFASLTSSPIVSVTLAVACLSVSGSDAVSFISGCVFRLCAACLALPLAVGLLLVDASTVAWLSLLMRAPRRLLLDADREHRFAGSVANFLSPIGCILAIYLTQCHCAAAGVTFLLITQLLKTAAARLNSANPSKIQHSTAATSADAAAASSGDDGQNSLTLSKTAAEAVAAMRWSAVLAHQTALTTVCALLACLCGPSLFVWAKALQQQANGGLGVGKSAPLPVADPHYRLGVAFALLYAVDSALMAVATAAAARSPDEACAARVHLSWPVAMCAAVAVGSVAGLHPGDYAIQASTVLLVFAAYTLANCARAWQLRSASGASVGSRPKSD